MPEFAPVTTTDFRVGSGGPSDAASDVACSCATVPPRSGRLVLGGSAGVPVAPPDQGFPFRRPSPGNLAPAAGGRSRRRRRESAARTARRTVALSPTPPPGALPPRPPDGAPSPG